jgi:RNA polymerase sigma-70 factor (ECF subfamily)
MAMEAESPHDRLPAEAADGDMPLLAEGNAGCAPDGAGSVDLASLVADHHGPLYRYAFRLTGSVHDAEDLTQQVFLIAREKIGQVRQAEQVRGWLYTVLRNCYLKGLRLRRPTPATTLDINLDGLPEELDESPIDVERLQSAIMQLPDDFRLALLMFYFEDLSYREIADALAIPLGTVMSRLARAKHQLKRYLQPSSAAQAEVPPSPLRVLPIKAVPIQSAAELALAGAGLAPSPKSLLPTTTGPLANRP